MTEHSQRPPQSGPEQGQESEDLEVAVPAAATEPTREDTDPAFAPPSSPDAEDAEAVSLEPTVVTPHASEPELPGPIAGETAEPVPASALESRDDETAASPGESTYPIPTPEADPGSAPPAAPPTGQVTEVTPLSPPSGPVPSPSSATETPGTESAPATEVTASSPVPAVTPPPVPPPATDVASGGTVPSTATDPVAVARERANALAQRAAVLADERPEAAVGGAFAGGFLIALILKRLAR